MLDLDYTWNGYSDPKFTTVPSQCLPPIPEQCLPLIPEYNLPE